MDNYSDKERFNVEKCITFLGNEVNRFCRNKKPVILHSIRVGMKCIDYHRPIETVIVGLLHDVVEDTRCTQQKIQKAFGKRVGQLVQALTMDYAIKDFRERWRNSVARIKSAGPEAILIRLIDMHDNFPYYNETITKKRNKQEWLAKNKIFIDAYSPIIGQHPLFQELEQMYNEAVKSH